MSVGSAQRQDARDTDCLETAGPGTEPDPQEAAGILDMLDRWDARLNGHQNQKRKQQRASFRSQIVIQLPELASFDSVPESESHLRVWARNLSSAGIGFLHRGRITSRRVIVCLDPDTGARHSYTAKIVRSRRLPNSFYEYGAVFLNRIEPSH